MITFVSILAEHVCLYLPLVMGAYISLGLLRAPDFISMESAYTSGAIAASCVLFYCPTMPLPLCLLVALAASICAGALVGLVSSTLTMIAGFPHLLSSLLTAGLFHGINQLVLGNGHQSLSGLANPLISGTYTQHPELIMLALICCVILFTMLVLGSKQIGYALAAHGNNPHFLAHYAISTRYVFMLGIIMANACAGISGYLVAQTSAFVDINAGQGMALLAVTALIVGTALRRKEKPINMLIPLYGLAATCMLQQILLRCGLNLKFFTAFQAGMIMLIMLYRYRRNPSASSPSNMLGI